MHQVPARIGSYEIVIELAAGGMATTYIAHKRGDAFFERLVAIKRIHPWLLKDPKSGDMLRDEARLGAALQHPNVVHVEDVAMMDGEVCLVMPYVESLSLGALLAAVHRAGERMPPSIASRIMLDVLFGLHAAHEAKDLRDQPLDIVHRDLSPNNVLVGTEGQSRIIDFGIARAKSRLCQTQSGDLKGTIAYMSPEQLRRRELDRRADVFAAGAVLYEMLVGERLFDGRDEADILIGVLADEVPSVHQRCPDISPEIDSVLSSALARDREERYPDARTFAENLEKVLPPAPVPEVAAFVRRFGEDEFARRREAIRAFVDRNALEVSPAANLSELPAVDPTPGVPRRRFRHRMIAMVCLGTLGALVPAFWIARARVEPDRAIAEDARSITPVVKRLQLAIPVTPSAPEPILDQVPPVASQGLVLPESSARSKPPVTVVPTMDRIHEKVDKSHASELQENPYR